MQFRISITNSTPDIEVVERAIRTVDPSGVADIDQAGETLRVSAAVDSAQLLELMTQAGHPVIHEQLELVPSECCGGCGG
jgi:hypothetical protein